MMMADRSKGKELEYRQYGEFDEDDPILHVRILAMRVGNLTREKEHLEAELKEEERERKKLEERIASMERTFQRGAGAVIVLPIIGTLIGVILAYGKLIFAPWFNGKP